MNVHTVLTRLRRPEYTGENRCTPCTVVNTVVAITLSVVVTLVSFPLAILTLGLCLTVIYLRGYLVPGTPELTKQYFPDRVLRWFDKAPDGTDAALTDPSAERIDPEPLLLEADALELTADGTDLRLTDEFRTEWHERVEAIRESDYRAELGEIVVPDEELDPEAVEVRIGDRNVTAFHDDTRVAMWPSEAALVADVAAAQLLGERLPEWQSASPEVRDQLLHGIRAFLEDCPTCSGELALSEETVESCCRTAEVVVLTCRSCDERLLEAGV